jgi:hypothetical protein
MRDCETKFNTYLLYSTRPKNNTKNYSIHIDIYEKISRTHRRSYLILLNFSFLSMHRVATILNIPSTSDTIETCSNYLCNHGQCIQYSNNIEGATFCRCNHGWTGRYCDIPFSCTCSSDSLCLGILANNRSLCLCPLRKWGSQCLLQSIVCQSDQNNTCQNGGECIPVDDNMISDKDFICLCPRGFTGDRCEKRDTTLIVSFHKNISLPQSILFYFIREVNNVISENGLTYKTISSYQNSLTVH